MCQKRRIFQDQQMEERTERRHGQVGHEGQDFEE